MTLTASIVFIFLSYSSATFAAEKDGGQPATKYALEDYDFFGVSSIPDHLFERRNDTAKFVERGIDNWCKIDDSDEMANFKCTVWPHMKKCTVSCVEGFTTSDGENVQKISCRAKDDVWVPKYRKCNKKSGSLKTVLSENSDLGLNSADPGKDVDISLKTGEKRRKKFRGKGKDAKFGKKMDAGPDGKIKDSREQ